MKQNRLLHRAKIWFVLSLMLLLVSEIVVLFMGDKMEVHAQASETDVSGNEVISPKVVINIRQPDGWYTQKATIYITVNDTAKSGNFEVAQILAKIGQNGSWVDVTEDKKITVSENCTVYVQVTDQNGNTYEKNRAIRCFDTTKPTLNAAVSDGLLSIQVYDTESGAKVVYVNGYEFTDLTNGTVNIRLQQFDAGYENFAISAMDNAGNMSDIYKTKNPYYKTDTDSTDKDPAAQLPVSAEPTAPGSATGAVTEHYITDSEGNAVLVSGEEGEREREFYTIHTASEKVFYLIVDRDGDDEVVYFLTEITENDLLNTTSDNSETLPKNSAAIESAIPVSDSALPNNNVELPAEPAVVREAGQTDAGKESVSASDTDPESADKQAVQPQSSNLSYIFMAILAVGVIGGAYYFKVVRKKNDGFIDEDDEEEAEAESEDEEEESGEDDFFREDDSDENE